MSKRARYSGPYPSVAVSLPSGKTVEVENGHLLPEEHEGESVPASVRDNLLEQADWSEVEQSKPNREER